MKNAEKREKRNSEKRNSEKRNTEKDDPEKRQIRHLKTATLKNALRSALRSALRNALRNAPRSATPRNLMSLTKKRREKSSPRTAERRNFQSEHIARTCVEKRLKKN